MEFVIEVIGCGFCGVGVSGLFLIGVEIVVLFVNKLFFLFIVCCLMGYDVCLEEGSFFYCLLVLFELCLILKDKCRMVKIFGD